MNGRGSQDIRPADALVAGAGIAGLALALGLARGGRRTLCLDAAPAAPTTEDDPRSAALMPESVEWLRQLDVWSAVEASAAPLRSLRIVDRARARGREVASARFAAAEAGSDALAWNAPNAALHAALTDAAVAEPHLDLHRPARIVALSRGEDAAFALLDTGERVCAQLVVGADGRNSESRRDAGIDVWRWSGGRTAIAFRVRTDKGLGGLCTEVHVDGEVLTTVPLPGDLAAVVWVLPGPKAARILAGPEIGLVAEFNRSAAREIGRARLEGPVRSWPEEMIMARRLVARRLALAGEAAHALSPVGAQGLNLSLADGRQLCELAARTEGADLGTRELLDAYQRTRAPRVVGRIAAVGGYAAACRAASGPIIGVRRAGLTALGRSKRLRRLVVRAATGFPRSAASRGRRR